MQKTSRNNSIDIARYICAVLVVLIHIPPFLNENKELNYIVSTLLTRIAVPYFFCISGYYYIGKIIEKKADFKRTFFPIVKTYVLWTILYYTYDIVMQYKKGLDIKVWIRKALKNFFFYGSAGPFWFFIALLLCIILVTALNRYGLLKIGAYISMICYFVGCVCWTYFKVLEPTFLSGFNEGISVEVKRFVFDAVPFYFLGYFVYIFRKKHDVLSIKNEGVLFVSAILLYTAEIIFIMRNHFETHFVISFSLYDLIFILVCVLLFHPCEQWSEAGEYCRSMANFTYFSHILLRSIIRIFYAKIFQKEIGQPMLFFSIICVAALIAILIVKTDNKILKEFL